MQMKVGWRSEPFLGPQVITKKKKKTQLLLGPAVPILNHAGAACPEIRPAPTLSVAEFYVF